MLFRSLSAFFPITFPNATVSVTSNAAVPTGSGLVFVQLGNITTTGFSFAVAERGATAFSAGSAYWTAVGY